MTLEAPNRPVALLTGASRGIGHACALRLARAGYDLVLTGRSVEAPVDHGRHALSGTLRAVEQQARAHGAASVVAALDLLDGDSIEAAVASGLERFGRIDAVVHAATYIAPGMEAEILDLPLDALDASLHANVVGSVHLAQCVLPSMLERGEGVWISLVSGAAVLDPPYRADAGGWGFLYGAQKAGLYRLAGVLNTEYGERGLRAYNLQPGVVATEVLRKSLGSDGTLAKDWGIAEPEVPASVIEWLIREDRDGAHRRGGVDAQKLFRELNLAAAD